MSSTKPGSTQIFMEWLSFPNTPALCRPSSSTAMASAVWMQRMKGEAKMAKGRWMGSLP
jgi:hypothetical protein